MNPPRDCEAEIRRHIREAEPLLTIRDFLAFLFAIAMFAIMFMNFSGGV